MPVLTRAIEELPTHIFMPVAQQLAHRVLASMEYSEAIGDSIYIDTDWSTHYRTTDIDGNVNVGQQGLRVNLNVRMNPMSQKFDCYTFKHTVSGGIGQRALNSTKPIFLDINNYVRLIEHVGPVTLELNCELTIVSSDLAFRTPLQIFNGHENGSIFNFVDLVFDYPIPKPIVSVLYGIWEMDRTYGKPAGIPFIKYLKENSENGIQVAKNRDMDTFELVIPSFNLKSLCVLEYSDDSPQGMMENKLPIGFNIPFVLTAQFGMPTLNILNYPVVINNQLLPEKFIPIDNNQRFNRLPEMHMEYAFEHYRREYAPSFPRCVQLPHYDDWVPPDTAGFRNYCQKPMVIAHLLMDETKDITEVNLDTDFEGSLTLSPLVKEFLYQQGRESMEYDTLFSVSLFREDKCLTPISDFDFNENLILTVKPINLHSRYRMVICVAGDLSKINKKWWDLIGKYYPFLPYPIKDQVKDRIENGSWGTLPGGRLPGGNGDLTIGDDGSLTDGNGNNLGNVSNLETFGGNGNVNSSASRIARGTIIASKPSQNYR